MAGNIIIPGGRKVEFLIDDEPLLGNIPLVLEEDVSFSASSSFGTLMGGGGGLQKILTYAGRVVSDVAGVGFGGQIKQMGMQSWQSTDPLSLNLVFTFYLGIADLWDAFEEVKKPIFELIKLTLPKEGLGVGGVETLIAPGPSPLEVLKGSPAEGKVNFRSISLDVGGILYMPEVIVKKVQPTFSSNVDDRGNPIWGKVSVDIQSLFTATGDMFDEELLYQDQTGGVQYATGNPNDINDRRGGTGAV